MHSPLIDTLVYLDPPPLLPCIDAGYAARLVITADHHYFRHKASDDAVFGVYQDWVHQKPGNNMDGVINEDVM